MLRLRRSRLDESAEDTLARVIRLPEASSPTRRLHRAPAAPCYRCDFRLTEQEHVCPHCEAPTQFMTFEERLSWELEQWRHYQQRARQA